MGELEDEQEEAFCQQIAWHNRNQSEAYQAAYPDAEGGRRKIWNAAAKLAQEPHVRARIDELMVQMHQDPEGVASINEVWVIRKMLDGIAMAEKQMDHRAVISGAKTVGEFLGLQHTPKPEEQRERGARDMTDAELIAIIDGRSKGSGEAPPPKKTRKKATHSVQGVH